MSASNPRQQFRDGVKSGLPFIVVGMPFGMLFGVVGMEAGLNLAEVMGFSVLVIAGTAQFAAVQLMVENAPTVIVLATALAVNLRMAMYSAALAPHLSKVPFWRKLLMSYFLVDQSYAMSIQRYEDQPDLTLDEKVAFYTGVFVSFMPFWYIATYLGAVLGTAIPPEVGLDMALPLMFLAMIGPMLRTLAHMAAAFTSLVLGLVFAFLPWNLGLLVAALVALLVGAEIERRMAK